MFDMQTRYFGIALLAAIISVPAAAQVTTASLEGFVQDSSGASIPSVQVEVLNTSTGVKTAAVTGLDGRFLIPSLQAGGPYTVKVEAAGFKTEERSGITLEVNQS